MALLSWFGYRAITEWRSASISLASRRASEAADLLVQALSRDMTGVQQSVLSSPEWRYFNGDRPQDMTSLIASGFARYPYPESFFAWTSGSSESGVVFFNRSDRPPSWTTAKSETGRFPVIIARDASLAGAIMERVMADARRGRQLSAIDVREGDVAYHVVAQLTYADIYREHLAEVVGFTVNSAWVRKNYFSDLDGREQSSNPEITMSTIPRGIQMLTLVFAITAKEMLCCPSREHFCQRYTTSSAIFHTNNIDQCISLKLHGVLHAAVSQVSTCEL